MKKGGSVVKEKVKDKNKKSGSCRKMSLKQNVRHRRTVGEDG